MRLLSAVNQTQTTHYLWLGVAPVAQIDKLKGQKGSITYLHADHLLTPRAATNEQQKIVWRWQSDAFGETAAENDPDKDGPRTQIQLRFPGQYADEESGLYYNVFRYYDPKNGRYTQSDPIGLWGGLNTYGYVYQNPLSNIDPSGLDCVATNASLTCTPPGGPTVTFPRPAGWPDVITENSPGYHSYDIPVPLNGADSQCVMTGIINSPTPGNPSPATPGGTPNNATPTTAQAGFDMVDYLSSFGGDAGGYNNSPVISYLLNGGSVVVNVTQPGHPLHTGYVVRTIAGSEVHNYGEGVGRLQAWYSPVANFINGVWNGQTSGIINSYECSR